LFTGSVVVVVASQQALNKNDFSIAFIQKQQKTQIFFMVVLNLFIQQYRDKQFDRIY